MRWLADLRFAARTLRKTPVVTGAAVLSLALGIGANTAIFSLLDQLLLRPLPVQEPERLVVLQSEHSITGSYHGDLSDRLFSYPMYRDLQNAQQSESRVFDGLIARCPIEVSVVSQGRAETAQGELVSGNFFQALGVRPAAGRLLIPADDVTKGAHPLAVLGYGYWLRHFGANPGVIGQAVRVNGTPLTIVGVAPRGFYGVAIGPAPDFFVPLTMKAQMTPTWDRLEDRNAHWLHILGRRRTGISLPQAAAGLQASYKPALQAELATIPVDLPPNIRKRFENQSVLLKPGAQGVPTFQEQAGDPLYLMMAMVALVLLIACANVASLLVARGLDRRKELALRLAIGACRWDVVRQLLAESVLLSLMGAAAGLLVAIWTASWIVNFGGRDTIWLRVEPDRNALLLACILGFATGIVFGLFPALRATRLDIHPVLKDQGSGAAGSFGRLRPRQLLVAAQVALSLLLLVGAGLFLRTLVNLRHLDPGFRTENLAVLAVDASLNGYSPKQIQQLYETIPQRLAAVPGVKSAAVADILFLAGDQNRTGIRVEGHEPAPGEDTSAERADISPGFLATLGVRLLQGRDFSVQDAAGSPKVAIVNQTFARHYFGNRSPIGQRITDTAKAAPDAEIIGVARDAKYDSLRNATERLVYTPVAQAPRIGTAVLHVRTSAPAETLMPALRREINRIDPTLAIAYARTMREQVDQSLVAERIVAVLCAAFGSVALGLACIGLYGVTAFSVTRRTREIGIRMALGARREKVLEMVLKEVALLAVIGVAAGLPAAIGLARLVQSQLYGVAPADTVTLVGAALLMVGTSLAAGFLPARRAAAVEPLEALRNE